MEIVLKRGIDWKITEEVRVYYPSGGNFYWEIEIIDRNTSTSRLLCRMSGNVFVKYDRDGVERIVWQ